MADDYDAVVIGSGPNGLAAAITLARLDRSVLVVEAADSIGGGLRSEALTGPGLVHDVCSTIHTLGASSPFMRSLPLGDHGVAWVEPDILLAHPVGDSAGLLFRDLDQTATGLGTDRDRYRSLISPIVEHWDEIESSVLGPILRWPEHPFAAARFGVSALRPALGTAARFSTSEAAALFTGCAAHSFLPLDRPMTSAFGLLLLATGHVYGWPFARGGSQTVADAMATYLRSLGGVIETGRAVGDLSDIPRSRVVLADLGPGQLADIVGDRLPDSALRAYRRFRHGPAAFKIDYSLTDPVPWTNPDLRRAGTIHLGGTPVAIAAAEGAAWHGSAPARPFTLVTQPTVFDPTRSTDGRHALWVYGHVPNGSTSDHTAAIEALIIEQAPAFRDVMEQRVVTGPHDLQARNANLVGGDIAGGAHTLRQLIFRPTTRFDPYTTPLDRIFLCSASTPPGAGTHGMSGHHAATSAYRRWLS